MHSTCILSLAFLSVGNVWVDSHEDASKIRIGPAPSGDEDAIAAAASAAIDLLQQLDFQ